MMWRGSFVCIFNNRFTKVLLLNRNWEKKKKERKVWEGSPRWGNIGGSVEAGETPLQACIREASEEIGVNLGPERLVLVHVRRRPAAKPTPYVAHFYATTMGEGTRIRLNDESKGYGWFRLEDLPDGLLDDKEDLIGWRDTAKGKLKLSTAGSKGRAG